MKTSVVTAALLLCLVVGFTAQAAYVLTPVGSAGTGELETFLDTVPSGFESAPIAVDFDTHYPDGHATWSGNHDVSGVGGMSAYDHFTVGSTGFSIASFDINNEGVSPYTQLRHDARQGHKVYDWWYNSPRAWRILFDDPVDRFAFMTLSDSAAVTPPQVMVLLYSDENYTNQIGSDLLTTGPAYRFAISWAVTGSGGELPIRSVTLIPLFSNGNLHNMWATVVPEPATMGLLGLGVMAIARYRRSSR